MNETTQQTIAQALRTRILAGEFAPDQRLDEAHLAEQFGISRSPLRYARSVAERGVDAALARALQDCLREGDEIFRSGKLDGEGETCYAAMNGRFHTLIVEAAQNHAVSAALGLNDKVPFVSPATVVFDHAAREQQYMMLSYAHRQHHAIVGALLNGEGARVEALMKEHTHISKESLNLSAERLHLIAGAA